MVCGNDLEHLNHELILLHRIFIVQLVVFLDELSQFVAGEIHDVHLHAKNLILIFTLSHPSITFLFVDLKNKTVHL